MSNEIRYPIVTTREGNKITKVCVEDVYRLINRVQENMTKHWNNAVDILDGIKKSVPNNEGIVGTGTLIVGTGISQPCLNDAFDEEIGLELAFKKAKLNANLKKRNLLVKVWNEFAAILDNVDDEIRKINEFIKLDVEGVRQYNPDYLSHLVYTDADC